MRQKWEGAYVPPSDKEDVIRAEFALKGWKRDDLGRMNKGNLQLVFVFNEVRLKKHTPETGWKTVSKSTIDKLYEKIECGSSVFR